MSDLGTILGPNTNATQRLQANDSFNDCSNSRLQNFIAKTSNTTIASDIIDPLCTFDVELEFFPKDTFLMSLAKKYLKNGQSYGKEQSQFEDQLKLQIGFYVQSMTLPQMVMPEAGKVPTLFGEFPVNNLYAKPDNNTFTLTMLNTKISLHDFLFYPWMREVTLPRWSYTSQPYTTATATVKFEKHCNTNYVFVGCRPTQIGSRQPTQEPTGEPTRDVTMLFDFMYIIEANYSATKENNYDNSVLKNVNNQFENLNYMKQKIQWW